MDLRVKKTRNSIINAFLTLKAHKPLEKITVKELSELADINKATFYLHYKDIYDLSESLEAEVVSNITKNISHPNYLFTDTEAFVQELVDAYFSQRTIINVLFSDQRANRLPQKIEEAIRAIAFEQYPELEHRLEYAVLLSFSIHGGYYAYMQNLDQDPILVRELVGKISKAATEACHAFVESQRQEQE